MTLAFEFSGYREMSNSQFIEYAEREAEFRLSKEIWKVIRHAEGPVGFGPVSISAIPPLPPLDVHRIRFTIPIQHVRVVHQDYIIPNFREQQVLQTMHFWSRFKFLFTGKVPQ